MRPLLWLACRSLEARLFLVELAARVEAVEVEYGVEDEEVAPVRLAAPDRIYREEQDVTAARRHVNDRRVLRYLAAVVEQARDEQVLHVRIAQHDARALRGRDEVWVVTRLLVRDGDGLPDFGVRLFG